MKFIYNHLNLKEHRRTLRRRQTEAERILWQRLRNRQLEGLKFFRQYSVGSFILDFYCPIERLAIEVDGGQHMQDAGTSHDKQRTEYLNKQKIKVLRFWNNEITKNIEGVIGRVVSEISSNPLTPPYSKGEKN